MPTIRGWDFPIRVDKETGKIKTIEDNENIKKGINIILNTNNFERKGAPDFGADIMPLLFKEISSTFLGELERRVRTAIRKWEEHITELEVSLDLSMEEKGTVFVIIKYSTDINHHKETVFETITVDSIKREEMF